MKSGIYRIVNAVDGKCYVGSAIDLAKRWREHRTTLQRGVHFNAHLQRAWNLHGADVFAFEVLERCGEDRLIDREQHHIDTLGVLDPARGYNRRPKASSNRGLKLTAEQCAAIGARKRGIRQSPEWVAARIAGLRAARAARGGPSEAEAAAIEARAAKRRGRPQHPSCIEANRRRLLGQPQSPDLIERRIAPLRGRPLSEGHKAAISAGKIGVRRTDVALWAPEKFRALTDDQVAQIRDRNASGESQRALAAAFGCTQATINRAVRGIGTAYAKR